LQLSQHCPENRLTQEEAALVSRQPP
jgi:hypothetical protein